MKCGVCRERSAAGESPRGGKAGFILSERAARSWRHGHAQRTESRVLGCSAGRPERPGRRTARDRRRGPPRHAAQPAPTRREVHWTARVVQYSTLLYSTVLYAGVARPRRCLPCLFDWLFWRAGSYRGARQIAPGTGLLCDESTEMNVWYAVVVYSSVYPAMTAQDGTSAPQGGAYCCMGAYWCMQRGNRVDKVCRQHAPRLALLSGSMQRAIMSSPKLRGKQQGFLFPRNTSVEALISLRLLLRHETHQWRLPLWSAASTNERRGGRH
jgi:hypothetical protein